MRAASERVVQMKKEFMGLHEKGLSIYEIAEKFNLIPKTVYNHLQEIANENGVDRSDLLRIIRNPRSDSGWEREHRKVQLDVGKIKLAFKQANEKVSELIATIDEVLEVIENEN